MSDDTPTTGGATEVAGDGVSGGAGGPTTGASPVTAALRELTPPRHGRTFWSDLDTRLADEPQLRLAPRSAIRPITQPPPVIDDRNLASTLKGSPPPRRRASRRTAVVVVLALFAVLVVVAALQDPDDTTTTDGGPETTDGRTPTSEEAATPPPDEAPETTAPPGTVDPAAPLTPTGVGPLTIGATLEDLHGLGMMVQIDQQMYDSSGGSCYKGKVPGALDLELRFRAPDGQRGADDPVEGVLTSIAIESGLPTMRGTDTGLALGSPQDQVLAAYAGNLDEWPHPFVAGGRIFRADTGGGTGAAFFTDGLGVIRIAVGEMASIRFINQCF